MDDGVEREPILSGMVFGTVFEVLRVLIRLLRVAPAPGVIVEALRL